jgi:GGDEF domain-containing protein
MFQPKKKQDLLNIRLPKLPGIPGFDDIAFQLIEAQRNRGRVIEMPWTSEDRAVSFSLTVKCDSSGDPEWTLSKGEGPNAKIYWTYPSGDTSLILNLVISECSGAGLTEVMDSSHFAQAPKAPLGSEDSAVTTPLPQSAGTNLAMTYEDLTKGKAKASLEGDLTNMQPPTLLQSITLGKQTGRLEVKSSNGTAEVYFADGAPLHAVARDLRGDAALIELILWDEGQFHFYPDERSSEKTINKRLDSLLMEGVALHDQCKYLASQGLQQESYLLRKNPKLTEAEFEQLVSRGAPVDMMAQKRLYQTVDNQRTLFEVLRILSMPKPEWAPIMFNMLSCGLVTVSAQPPRPASAPLTALGIDKTAIEAVGKTFVRAETEIYTYPAFLYHLMQEHQRCESFGWPFALLMLEVRMRLPDGRLEPLPLHVVREVGQRVHRVKRNLDIFAHYETFDFAMLLPNTIVSQSTMVANRVLESLFSSPLSNGLNAQNMAVAIGIVAMPEDTADLGMALAGALAAKNKAKETASPMAYFRDVKQG